MEREAIDWVNENNEVIGTTDAETAHATKQWHRVIAVYVFTTDGDLLVQTHKKSGLLDHSVGGHVRKGESYDDAAQREMREELGLSVPLVPISVLKPEQTNLCHIFGIYRAVTPLGWTFTPNDEVAQVQVMPLAKIMDIMQSSPEACTFGFRNTIMCEYVRVCGSQQV